MVSSEIRNLLRPHAHDSLARKFHKPVEVTPSASSATESERQTGVLAMLALCRGTGSRNLLYRWLRAPNVSQPCKKNVAHPTSCHHIARSRVGAERLTSR
jgi:hypothetical protein